MAKKPKESVHSKLPKAIKLLCKCLKKDSDYFHVWQSNIAMAFKDEYDRSREDKKTSDIHAIANDAAKNFLNQLINFKEK